MICSLSSYAVSITPDITIKDVNAEENYLKNLSNIIWIQQDLRYIFTNLQHIAQQVKEQNTTTNNIIPANPLQGNIDQSSITKQTGDALYSVTLSWDTLDVREGKNTIFMISFMNPKTNLEVKQIDYSFKAVYSSTKITIKDVKNQKAPTGTGV